MISNLGFELSQFSITNPFQSGHVTPNPFSGGSSLQSDSSAIAIPPSALGLGGGISTNNLFQDTQSFVNLINDSHSPLELSEQKLSKEDQAKVDALNKELDDIFGVAKQTLTDAEKAKEKSIIEAIEKIQQPELKPLDKAKLRQFDAFQEQINKLFEDGYLTADEEKKFHALQARIGKLFEDEGSSKSSKADEKKLDELYKQLDELYGIKSPSKEGIARSEEIFAELDKIYENAENGKTNVVSFDSLSKSDKEKAQKLLNSIDEVIADALNPKLNDEDQKRADALNKKINDLLGIKTPTDEQEKTVRDIDRNIARILADFKVTADEEDNLKKLEEKLQDIFGEPKKLSKEDSEKLEKLFARLDALYAKNRQSSKDVEFDKIAELSKELEDLFAKKSTV